MAETLLSIQEAAKISGKSIQTLRRALKAKKIRSQKKKTPQGFNYLVVQDSLMSFYKLKPSMFERDHASIKEEGKTSTQELSTEFATIEEFKKLENSIGHILDEHKKEKENFFAEPPTDNGGSEITSYSIEYQAAGANDNWTAILCGKDRECNVTGLTPGQTYHFRVSCVSKGGQSQVVIS